MACDAPADLNQLAKMFYWQDREQLPLQLLINFPTAATLGPLVLVLILPQTNQAFHLI
jgi:hypothetical protein